MTEMQNKVVLVTGGGSGIGQATAKLFAAYGAKVVVADLDDVGGNTTANEITGNDGEAIFIHADVSKAEACAALVSSVMYEYGQLDLAFNNAGIGGESNAIADMTIEGWNQIISVNLSSVFYCMKYELQEMIKQGHGAIVNMSSILGKVGFANSAGYVAAKHGVIGLTKNAALEYSSRGVRVNAVGPGFINTPLLAHAGIDDVMKGSLAAAHPMGRPGEPNEVAELVVWLCSSRASFVTGSYYAVDGGYLAR